MLVREKTLWIVWSEMEEIIPFLYLHRKDYFNIEFKEFDKSCLENKGNKFIQLYVYKKPIIIAGNDLYHRDKTGFPYPMFPGNRL